MVERAIQPLDRLAGPLVWIDCEMTGLNPKKDKILEIAVSAQQHFSLNSISNLSNGVGSHHEWQSRTCRRRYRVHCTNGQGYFRWVRTIETHISS
jgi:hypothetical protein